MPPLPTRSCHRISPLRSGSMAWTTPDFCPATSARRPLASVTRMGGEAKSKSGPSAFGAVDLVRQAAGGVPGVCNSHLAGPEDLAGIEIECHERIAVGGRRIAVVVSGGDVHGVPRRHRSPGSSRWARPTAPTTVCRFCSSSSAGPRRRSCTSSRSVLPSRRSARPGCRGIGSTRNRPWRRPSLRRRRRPHRAGRCETPGRR